MRITGVKSIVLRYDLEPQIGYSQQYFDNRTAHIIAVETDEGITGYGEAFGGGSIALGNKAIVEQTIAPMVVGMDPLANEVIWHTVYNRLRDHGQKGMPLQALSGIDIALWDIKGKVYGKPIYELLGGAFRDRFLVYGYGMMLERKPLAELAASFEDEAARIVDAGFKATKMKIGRGPKDDLALVEATRKGCGPETLLMVDANHCYTTREAIPFGRELEILDCHWFEEPVAPEDKQGYRELCEALDITIAGGECEYTRWGYRDLIENRCVDLLQPETCALGGITEYQKVLSLAHTHFVPVINHVWGSAVAVTMNLHLLAAMPPLPGGAHPVEPMLENDTTPNRFRDELLTEPLRIVEQVGKTGGYVGLPKGPGLGIELDWDFVEHFRVA